MQAKHDALSAVVEAALPILATHPKYADYLAIAHNEHMADRLALPVTDQSITEYREHLRRHLPETLQPVADQ